MKKDKIQSMYKACSAEVTQRTNDIFHFLLGEGNYDANVMVIGFLPSAKEEEYGQNILEDDRDKLLKVLSPLGLSVDDVYITYLMKYRPYRVNDKGRIVSRSPQEEELEFFMPYLEKEISLINPKLIITLGNDALRWLIGDKSVKVDTDEDLLYVTGILGKSYKLYPLHPIHTAKFDDSVSKFLKEDQGRVMDILTGAQIQNTGVMLSQPMVRDNQPGQTNQNVDSGFNPGSPMATSPMATGTQGDSLAGIKNLRSQSQLHQSGVSYDPSNNEETAGHKGLDHEETTGDLSTRKRVFHKVKVEETFDTGKTYVTIIYGGEGFVDDPVLVALERISSVLLELGIGIHRIDCYKGSVPMEKALSYINQSAGVILSTNVEWFGIGARLQHFLDQCFFMGDEKYFADKPLMGVAFTRHGFEREAYEYIRRSWEILGGRDGVSLLAAIDKASTLETNFDWLYGIDKKTEGFYRILKQEKGLLPRSKGVEKIAIETPVTEAAIPMNNPLPKAYQGQKTKPSGAMIEDYDTFVEKQHEDIKEISSFFKKRLTKKVQETDASIPGLFKSAYRNKDEVEAKIQLVVDDQLKENTVIELNNQHIRAYYGQMADVDVTISGKIAVIKKILDGKLTMQRAFMTGEVKAKGDFTVIYKFNDYFDF